ncbi:MAG: hypothetical protein HYU99_05775 [Deltaproteobacteria bacterium]|nr:hypothetical protein [Deltaproteobacteria bacterium]
MNHSKILVYSSVFFFLLSACGGSSGGGGSDGGGDDGDEITNTLGDAYPTDLALASPFATSSGGSALKKQEAFTPPVTHEEKKEVIAEILEADTPDGCFNFSGELKGEETRPECYGPPLALTGTHPDGGGLPVTLPGGDLGIMEEYEGDEACIATKVNNSFEAAERRTDFAQWVTASILCVANQNGIALPATVGESVDLTDEYTAALPDRAPITPDSVTLQLVAAGTYKTSISGTVESPEGDTFETAMSLTHAPLDATNSTFEGLLQHRVTSDNFGAMANCGAGTRTAAASVLYAKESASSLKVRFKHAMFCGEADDADVFDANGEVDPTNKYATAGNDCAGTVAINPNGWGDTFVNSVMNTDPETGFGKMTWAWQAGRCDGHTRVAKASILATGGTDGAPGGCGYVGFGPDAAEDTVGDTDGMICNWTGPGSGPFNGKTIQDLVQRQCVTLEDGVYVSVSDQLNIAYAPTNSCDSNGALFCDGVACVTTNDLLDIDEMSFTAPTPPDPL